MKKTCKKSGLTLTEMAVVAAIIGLLVALGIPAIRTVMHSFESESGARAMVSSALASARAIAARNQEYAGIRFQPDADGRQHMIFIIHDPAILASGFRAIPGVKPIGLPDSVGVMDMMVRTYRSTSTADCAETLDEPIAMDYLDDHIPGNIGPDGANTFINDARTFSIIFAPSGRIVRHDVRVRNRQGVFRPLDAAESNDDIFNSPVNIANGFGRFVQDDYSELGFGAEFSRNRLVIYDRIQMKDSNAQERLDYLRALEFIYINAYTGSTIKAN